MALELELTHSLRSFVAALELSVGEERTFALVGPSGAGKTTVLRAISGLLAPDEGRIAAAGEVWLDTRRGVDLPPERRRVGYLFQEYALFPHLDVHANVRFGAAPRTDVAELLERFRIAHLRHARVTDLSGGERQRVALARALARDPAVLLLDEPLAALDAHTRVTVRAELHEVLAVLAIPTVLVTHDFEDAASLADEVGVIVEGRVLQVDTAAGLVAAPASPFVASFTGATLLAGTAAAGPDGLTEVSLDAGITAWSTDTGAGRVALSIYPWEVSIAREAPADTALNHVRAPIVSLVELGNRVRLRVGPLAAEVTAGSAARLGLREGDVVVASFKATAARLLPL
jgi:ABC-type sulfate/molybdate transport systems ATPase subunit